MINNHQSFIHVCIQILQVYKALLNDVTEVAAKQLHTSSESQIALFKREIAIHKRCRSVSPEPLI